MRTCSSTPHGESIGFFDLAPCRAALAAWRKRVLAIDRVALADRAIPTVDEDLPAVGIVVLHPRGERDRVFLRFGSCDRGVLPRRDDLPAVAVRHDVKVVFVSHPASSW